MINAINNIHPNFSLKEAIDFLPLTASPNITLAEALNLLTTKPNKNIANSSSENLEIEQKKIVEHNTCLLIVEEDRLIGIVTEQDFVRFAFEKIELDRVKVGEVMTKNLITISESNTWDLFYVLNLFREHKIRHLPVLDINNKLVGIVSQESLRRIMQPDNLLKLKQVAEALDRDITYTSADTSIQELIKIMVDKRTTYVLIVENNNKLQPLGIVTERDIVKFQRQRVDLETTLAGEVMSYPLFSIKINESLWQAHQKMQQRGIRRLVVFGNSGELAGVLTETNLTQAIDPVELLTAISALQEEVDKRTEKLTLMAEREGIINTIARKINRSLELQEILDIIVTEIQKILKVDRVIVYSFYLDWTGIVSAEAISDKKLSILGEQIKDPDFEQSFLSTYQQGKIKAIEDTYTTTAVTPAYRETLARYRIRANLVVPILLSLEDEKKNSVEKSLWGLLIVHQCHSPRKWQTEEIEFLQKLATHLAIAIQQSKLFNLLQKELSDREEYEKALETAKEDLETEVNDRTYQLLQINEQLQQEIREHKLTEKTLQQSNLQLAKKIEELQQRQEERALLHDTINFIQVCLSVEEACKALATLIQPIFPDTSGAVFKIDPQRDLMVEVAHWGTDFKSERVFSPSECWGLRRSRHHWVKDVHVGLACSHIKHSKSRLETLCLPMTAQGEAIGMLYFNAKPGKLTEIKRKLAINIAEQTALAIANLKLREKLEYRSVRDPLTSLFNRSYSEAFLCQEIDRATRKERTIGIILIDIDNFKQLNDSYGGETRDTIFQEISTFILNEIDKSDLACRYSREEILLILPEASREDTQQIARQLQQGISNLEIKCGDRVIDNIFVYFGVSCFPEDGQTTETLIQAAQESLYQTKTQRDRGVING